MLSASLQITVNQDSPVPICDQLVEQIGLQIASGTLKGNEKLPSIRALAQKLSIHQSIVHSAYNQLAEVGMLQIRHGSGVQVVPQIGLNDGCKDPDLHSMFMQFVSKAAESGYSREAIKDFCQQFFKRKSVSKIVVIDRNSDFHPIILSELKPHFSIPIITATTIQLKKDPSLLDDALVITSLYHFVSVQSLPIDPTRFLICNVQPAQELVDLIKSLPDASIVLFVSASPTLLKIGFNIAAGLRGESISVKCHSVDEVNEIAYTAKYAKAIICDRPSQSKIIDLIKKAPVHMFELYSPETIQLIKNRLAEWG